MTSDQSDITADTVLYGGKVITVDRHFSIAEAVAVKNDRIIGVGRNSEIKKLAGEKTETVDLDGKVVVPGFIDGHAHMDREGLKCQYPSLDGKRSVRDILKTVEKEVKRKKPGEWVVTMPIGDYPHYYDTEGPDYLTDGRFPNRWDLDRISPDNPVYIRGIWYYWRKTFPIVSIGNSYALKLAGINRNTVPPYEGIEILREEESGEPTGVFLEWDQPDTVEFSLMEVLPRFTHEDRVKGLKKSMEMYNAVGTTSVYEGHGISSETLRAFKTLWEAGDMSVRSYLVLSPAWDAVPGAEIEEVLRDWATYASGVGFGDHMLKLGGIWTSVGCPPTDQIRRKERPYTGWAGYGVDQSLPPERGSLYDLILAAVRTDLRVNGIAAAPAILNQYLDVLARVDQQIPIMARRFVLQHLSYVGESQLNEVKRLGIVPTMIPSSSMWMWGSDDTKDADQEKLNTYFPFKDFAKRGVPFVLCTDNNPIDPLHVYWVTVSRKDRKTGSVIAPGQKISREETLRALTINGAYLTFEEGIKGSIEVNKLADLAVLSDDLLTCPEEKIRDIEVLLTMVGGQIVHREEEYV